MTPIAEIQEQLKEQGLDGWLFYDHHVRDALAYSILRFQAPRTPTRRWYYLIPAEGEPVALTHRIEPKMLDALPAGKRLLYSSHPSMHEQLRHMLHGRTRVAMQHSPLCEIPYVAMVDAGTVDLIRSFGVDVASSANLVQHFQARWSAEQLETHLEAGRRVDKVRAEAFFQVFEAIRCKWAVTEFEIAEFIRRRFAEEGLITDHGPIVAVNANASNPHYEPTHDTPVPIAAGDLVLIDMWAKLAEPTDAVYYDITWTGFCGIMPPLAMLSVFETVRDARKKASQFVIDGVAAGRTLRGFEVDDVARGHIREAGYADYFVHRTGHSIGTDVHGTGANMDNLESHDTRLIIPRTCFSVEPGVYLASFGIRSEVNVYVGEGKAMVTGEQQEELLRL
ncbi:MAG: aminopeptidase P family protein [Bryobacterales bacterium]|nr:aminopeptidase P family protein [Bryobacterales bacterium]